MLQWSRRNASPNRKVIAHCLKITRANSIQLRRNYAKEIKQRKPEGRFVGYPNNRAKTRKAVKRLHWKNQSRYSKLESEFFRTEYLPVTCYNV